MQLRVRGEHFNPGAAEAIWIINLNNGKIK